METTSFVRRQDLEPRKTTDIDKWFQDQQAELFSSSSAARGQEGREGGGRPLRASRRAQAVQPGRKPNRGGLDVSADETKAVFAVSAPVPHPQRSSSYVTRSSYTEDIPGRAPRLSWTREGRLDHVDVTGEVSGPTSASTTARSAFAGWSPTEAPASSSPVRRPRDAWLSGSIWPPGRLSSRRP
jgi:hypothetical protein